MNSVRDIPESRPPEMHAILVANTIEGTIGFETNIDMMKRAVQRIAARTFQPLTVAVFEHEETRIANLTDHIKKMDIRPGDTVLFYINNHGIRNEDKSNPWPDLIFDFDRAINPNRYTLDFKKITEIFQEKHPRLLISIAESCNTVVSSDDEENFSFSDEEIEGEADDETSLEEIPELEVGPTETYRINLDDRVAKRLQKVTEDKTFDLYRKLFLDPKVTMMISSSSPGQAAKLGLFTPLFLENLETDMFLQTDVSPSQLWRQIVDLTSDIVRSQSKKLYEGSVMEGQDIQCEIQLQ